MEEIKGALACSVDQKAQIIKELAHGFELAKQLRTRMLITSSNPTFSEDDQALNYSLLDKMLSSFDKSISLARLFNFTEFHSEPSSTRSLAFSRPGYNESSSSSSLDRPHSRKRRKVPNRIEWVQVNPGRASNGLEGPLDDGFSWRKYGQKDILGAKFPRGYYRCTHRFSQSCAATKQVQRSDEDPSMYQVIYKGEHTCNTAAHLAQDQKKPNVAQIKAEPLPGQQPDPLPAQRQQQEECQIPQSNQQESNLGRDPLEGQLDQPKEREDEAQIFRAFTSNSAHLDPGLIDDDYNFLVSSCDFTSFGQFDFLINQLPEIDPNFSVDVAPLLCNI